MSEEAEVKKKRSGLERNFFLDLTDINLDTIEGQSRVIIECEKALLSMKLTPSDIKAISLIKDLVRTKKDLDTLRMYIELKNEIDKLKEKVDTRGYQK